MVDTTPWSSFLSYTGQLCRPASSWLNCMNTHMDQLPCNQLNSHMGQLGPPWASSWLNCAVAQMGQFPLWLICVNIHMTQLPHN